jgi:hypothetical protein
MPPIAPFVSAFRRRLANLPGPTFGTGEASNGQPITVELFVGGVWVDITSYCMVRDDSGQISLSYGITGGEGSQTDRAQGGLQLRNTDGRFSDGRVLRADRPQHADPLVGPGRERRQKLPAVG